MTTRDPSQPPLPPQETVEDLKEANRQLAELAQALTEANLLLAAQREELEVQAEELQAQQTELEARRRFVEALVEAVPAGILYVDRDMVLQEANRAYHGIARKVNPELPPGPITGQPLRDLFPGTDDYAEVYLRQIVADGQPRPTYAQPFNLPDGSAQYWDVLRAPVLGADDAIIGALSLVFDATRRVEMENALESQVEQLKALDALKDQFLSILSHELRTPINAIMGFSTILLEGIVGELEPTQAHYVTRLRANADNLLALVNDLLDMSAIQAGKFSVAPEPMAFEEVVENVLAGLGPLATQRGQTLTRDVPADLGEITADQQRVTQVLTNFVGNAIKFTPEGGAITVRAERRDGWLRCTVEDTGIGIAPADQLKLFLPFSQITTAATRHAGGTGLGLSISRSLIEAHGGQVGVESEPGRGSRFWFSLPAA